MTGDEGWTEDSLASGPWFLDPSAKSYVDDLDVRAMEFGGGVTIHGGSNLRFFSRFNRSLFWHPVDGATMAAIREYSDFNTRCGIILDFESVHIKKPSLRVGPIAAPLDVLWTVGQAHLLLGTDGKPVQLYPGAYAVDMRDKMVAEEYARALEWMLAKHYSVDRPDEVFFDCLQPRPYYALAGNAPTWWQDPFYTLQYRETWKRLLHLVSAFTVVGGHNPGGIVYSLGFGHEEHATRGVTLSQLVDSINHNANASVGLGFEWRDKPNGDIWKEVAEGTIRRAGQVYLQTARTGKAFRVWHPGPEVAACAV
jgi:hypothetical protein